MNNGILGSGMVAQAIAGKLAELGHAVKLGTRAPEKLAAWVAQTGPRATAGSPAEAAAFAERFVFNATKGDASLEALRLAGEAQLNGKILLDIANPLDFSRGMPPSLTVSNTDSLGEQIQRAFPNVRAVKTLNTLTAPLIVNPGLLPEDTAVFVGGNDAGVKAGPPARGLWLAHGDRPGRHRHRARHGDGPAPLGAVVWRLRLGDV